MATLDELIRAMDARRKLCEGGDRDVVFECPLRLWDEFRAALRGDYERGLEDAANWHDHCAAAFGEREDGDKYAAWHAASAAAIRTGSASKPVEASAPSTPAAPVKT